MNGTIDIDTSGIAQDIGGVKPLELGATRYRQGGRTHYHVALDLRSMTKMVRRPDPSLPLPGNRKVDASRARRFAEYLLKNDDWVSPALLLKIPTGEFEFTVVHQFGDSTAWGILTIEHDAMSDILDGQHRALGTMLAEEQITDLIKAKREAIRRLEQDQAVKKVLAAAKAEEAKLVRIRKRLSTEHISVDLLEVSEQKARQVFTDIASNAHGVSPDFRTYLDQRDPINRIAVHLIERHPLFKGRVELGQGGRMSAANTNLVGAKSVSDIVQAVLAGVGRLNRRDAERIADGESTYRRHVYEFLDVLEDSFDILGEEVMKGKLDGRQLRARSMLGSATMLRVLANAYRILINGDKKLCPKPLATEQIAAFFHDLEPHLAAIPVHDRLWLDTKAFVEGNSAPMGRQGSMKDLTEALVRWAQEGIPGQKADAA